MRLYLSLFALFISAFLWLPPRTHSQLASPGTDNAAEKDVLVFEGGSMLTGIRDGDKLTVAGAVTSR
jgi:hypothetical protein